MKIPEDHAVIAATRRWLQSAVIGLDLCPFARPVHEQGRIRYQVSSASTEKALAQDLAAELRFLAAAEPASVETTLLIHPGVLDRFLDYNEFLDRADDVLIAEGLEGTLQIASFHPRYQFAGTASDDVSNCTNRSPFPMLHLLREASIEGAIASHPDPSRIYERNIESLRRLGWEEWERMARSFTEPAA